MKNLKKLMSVILTVAMLMSMIVSTSAATFTDVDETNNAYEAIEVLSALEILEGKENGNFDPDANIKRSEFAAVVCRAMNAEAAAAGSATAKFDDVAADHWAAGYIAWAADAGIVNGRGNGIFDPDANVTYQEAVKMIVASMGFAPYAENKGGFPTGYMVVANAYKITDGVAMAPATGAADRKGVAQLVYNAFDAPLMDASTITFSGDDEYVIYDGGKAADGVKKTLLSQYHDIFKLQAKVIDTFRVNDAELIDEKGNRAIVLDVTDLYKFDAEDVRDGLKTASTFWNGKDTETTELKVLVSDDAAADFLNYTVNAYVTKSANGKANELIAMVADSTSVDELVIANPGALIDVATVVGDEVTLKYWKDADDDKSIKVKMADADEVVIYLNGVRLADGEDTAADYTSAEFKELLTSASTITLVGADEKYNQIKLTNYIYGIVEEIDAEDFIVTTEDGTDYDFAPEFSDETERFINFYKDGVAASFEDIAVGDMLNIIADVDADSDEWRFADVYITKDIVEGTVSAVVDEGAGVYVYTIGDEDYYVAAGADVDLDPGEAGSFYVTIDGYLFKADLTKATSGNYAFIIDLAKTTNGFGSVWQIKLLTKANAVVTLDVKNGVSIASKWDTDAFDGEYDTATYKDTALDAIMTAIANVDVEKTTDTDDVTEGLQALDNAATITFADDANILKRFVTFKDNGSEITNIAFADDSEDFNSEVLSARYNDKTGRLGAYTLLDETVIFNAPITAHVVNVDEIQAYSTSSLDADAEEAYAGYVFAVDNELAIGAALINNDLGFAGAANAFAVVKSVSTGIDAEGNTVEQITFFQAGEFKTLKAAAEGYVGAFENTWATNLTAGDVFQYSTNAAGAIYDLELVLNMAADYSTYTLVKDSDGGVDYYVGYVTKATASYADLDGGEFVVWDLDDNGTNVLFDTAKKVNNAFTAKTSASYIKAFKGASVAERTNDAYLVLVKVDDDRASEVVTYLFDEDATAATEVVEA